MSAPATQVSVEMASRDASVAALDILDAAEANPALVRGEVEHLQRTVRLLTAAIERVVQ